MENKTLLLLSLLLTILGIFILLLLIFTIQPLKISEKSELNNFQDNQKFLVEGFVTKEITNKNSKTLIINNKTRLICAGCQEISYLNENISAIAMLERFSDKSYLKILKIKILRN
jgi:hypothetical protein